MSKALFIGGPGNISTSCINEMLINGYEVGLMTLPVSFDERLKDSVLFFLGDRNDPQQIENVVSTFKPDVILDFVCFEPIQAEQAAKAARGKVQQYIFVSTVDVYGYPLSRIPMRERDYWNPPNCAYAANKLLCEQLLNAYSEQGAFALTVVRPAYSFGNKFVISFFSRDGGRDLIPRLRARLPVLVPGDGTTLLHASVAYNTGRMIAQTASAKVAEGKSYSCAHDFVLTHEEYVRLFADAIGIEPNLVYLPTSAIRNINRPEIDELLLWDVTGYNLFYSIEQFQTDFPDFVWEKSLKQAAQEYIEYNDREGLFKTSKPVILEDEIISAYQTCLEQFHV